MHLKMEKTRRVMDDFLVLLNMSHANQGLKDGVDYRRDESSSDFTQKPQGALRPRKGRQALRSLREKTELWNTLKRFRAKHAKQPQSTQSLRGLCELTSRPLREKNGFISTPCVGLAGSASIVRPGFR